MMSKFVIVALLLIGAIGAVAKSQAPELQRYLKIKKM